MLDCSAVLLSVGVGAAWYVMRGTIHDAFFCARLIKRGGAEINFLRPQSRVGHDKQSRRKLRTYETPMIR